MLISNTPPQNHKIPQTTKPLIYIIPTPKSPEMSQNSKNPPKVNGAPCIRHPKIAERPYQPTIPKNLKMPNLQDFRDNYENTQPQSIPNTNLPKSTTHQT